MTDTKSKSIAESYLERCSNWGRWGGDDQLGTLNLITEQHRIAAARLVTKGRTVSCARDLVTAFGDPKSSAQLYWVVTGECVNHCHGVPPSRFGADRVGSAVEFLGLVFHGPNVTHVDTPAHLFWDGKLYNGRPAGLTNSENGAMWCPVTAWANGIVGRGVLLDVPRALGVDAFEAGRTVTAEELAAAAEAQRVTIGEGDIVLLRTGRWHPSALAAAQHGQAAVSDDPNKWHKMSGWHPACVPWLHERGVAMIGCDYPQDPMPPTFPDMPGAIHVLSLVQMGMPLIDNCDLEALATTCAELGRWEFLFIVSALRIVGGSGSPVNPIAIF
jgi:kynurenine formamidase